MTGVWNEGEMSPGGREMATSSGEREERRSGLMTHTHTHTHTQKIRAAELHCCAPPPNIMDVKKKLQGSKKNFNKI